jgi:NAD-dependent deacetylase
MQVTRSTERAAEIINDARRVLVLTGAGMSAESGVPTFRSGGGATTWRGLPVTALSSAEMVDKDLRLVWEWFDYRRSVLAECKPNAGHFALAAAQTSGRFESFTVVTQNIDNLHTEAGSGNVIELHGNIHQARCLSCKGVRMLNEISHHERPPVCLMCNDAMRPNVVLFGEMLDRDTVEGAYRAAEGCDVCLVVGTSALVSPANTLPPIAQSFGARLIELNPEETHISGRADVAIREFSSDVLRRLFRAKQ